MKGLWIWLLVITIGVTGPALALFQPAKDANGIILVIGPAGADFDGVLAALNGRRLGPDRAPFAVFASFDAPPDDLVSELRARGLWGAVNGAAFAAICGVNT